MCAKNNYSTTDTGVCDIFRLSIKSINLLDQIIKPGDAKNITIPINNMFQSNNNRMY